MDEKSITLKTLLSNWRTCFMPVENIVLAISYIFVASYYLLLAFNLLIC